LKYDEDVEHSNYKGPEEVVTVVKEFRPPIPKDARFIDVCAGTGRLARMASLKFVHSVFFSPHLNFFVVNFQFDYCIMKLEDAVVVPSLFKPIFRILFLPFLLHR
jgi:hypothetical protein